MPRESPRRRSPPATSTGQNKRKRDEPTDASVDLMIRFPPPAPADATPPPTKQMKRPYLRPPSQTSLMGAPSGRCSPAPWLPLMHAKLQSSLLMRSYSALSLDSLGSARPVCGSTRSTSALSIASREPTQTPPSCPGAFEQSRELGLCRAPPRPRLVSRLSRQQST